MWQCIEMFTQLTLAFTGKESVIQASFLPEITLDEEWDYSCALLDLFIKKQDATKWVDVLKSDLIYVHCDLILGSYINGVSKQTIHQFVTSASHVNPHTIAEIPKQLNYFPIKTNKLSSIQISLTDREGAAIFTTTGVDIFSRIKIKRDIKEKIN